MAFIGAEEAGFRIPGLIVLSWLDRRGELRSGPALAVQTESGEVTHVLVETETGEVDRKGLGVYGRQRVPVGALTTDGMLLLRDILNTRRGLGC